MTHPSPRGGIAVAVAALALTMAACSPQPTGPLAGDLAPIRALGIAAGGHNLLVGSGEDASPEGPQATVRHITVPPGSRTGEHCHHGHLAMEVEKGQLTHYSDIYPDGVHVYRAGDTISEGARHIHDGVNEGTEPLELTVTYFTPEGNPTVETDLTQCEG